MTNGERYNTATRCDSKTTLGGAGTSAEIVINLI